VVEACWHFIVFCVYRSLPNLWIFIIFYSTEGLVLTDILLVLNVGFTLICITIIPLVELVGQTTMGIPLHWNKTSIPPIPLECPCTRWSNKKSLKIPQGQSESVYTKRLLHLFYPELFHLSNLTDFSYFPQERNWRKLLDHLKGGVNGSNQNHPCLHNSISNSHVPLLAIILGGIIIKEAIFI